MARAIVNGEVGIVPLIALDCDLNPAKEPQASFHSPDLQLRSEYDTEYYLVTSCSEVTELSTNSSDSIEVSCDMMERRE
jgi:hypothetical protein